MDAVAQQREGARARRVAALQHNAAIPQVRALFEEEIQLAAQQLKFEERKYNLGVSNRDAVTCRQLDLNALQREFAAWKGRTGISSPAERDKELRPLIEETIAVSERHAATLREELASLK
jgi:hypothetical protein